MPLPPDPDPSSPAAMTAPAPPPWSVHVIEALHTLRIAPCSPACAATRRSTWLP
ncbi:hypothetical protein [Acidovorax sp.]|uniref:hypothetical protein n=1 Tax=Acidovorax sp. TaxID=1872122 RepID=UPI00391F22AD